MAPAVLALLALAVIVSLPLIEPWLLRRRQRRQLEQCSILPEQLHAMIRSGQRVLIFDIRQPVDLLAEPEVIPGSRRVLLRELIANPDLLPKNRDAVLYCACPGEETSLRALRRVRDLGFFRVKFLKGGMAAWKAGDFPVEPYSHSFRLDTAS
jgi:rhodanese-related sulfurtransferase